MTERAIHHRLRIDGGVMLGGKPVGRAREKLIVFPAAVAKYAWHQALIQRLDNAGGSGKIHV